MFQHVCSSKRMFGDNNFQWKTTNLYDNVNTVACGKYFTYRRPMNWAGNNFDIPNIRRGIVYWSCRGQHAQFSRVGSHMAHVSLNMGRKFLFFWRIFNLTLSKFISSLTCMFNSKTLMLWIKNNLYLIEDPYDLIYFNKIKYVDLHIKFGKA